LACWLGFWTDWFTVIVETLLPVLVAMGVVILMPERFFFPARMPYSNLFFLTVWL
jgi:hypothetical protein